MGGTKTNASVKYALSIFMKYGEVLHVEGVNREVKDRYFELAKSPNSSMLVEDSRNIRNIHGSDIANISVKRYDAVYEKTFFQAEKMLFSESSVGRGIYFTAIKIFLLLSALAIASQLVVAAMSGDIMELIMDLSKISTYLDKGIKMVMSLFRYTVIIMFLISAIDIILGLNAHYHINRDGDPPVVDKRVNGIIITLGFLVVMLIAKSIF